MKDLEKMTAPELENQLSVGRRALKVLTLPSDQHKIEKFIAEVKRLISLKTQ